MEITLNGQRYEVIEDGLTVAQLLERLELGGGPVAVEVNGQVVPRARHEHYRLTGGEVVEVVGLVGGG